MVNPGLPVFVASDAPLAEQKVFRTLFSDGKRAEIYAPTVWEALSYTFEYGLGRVEVIVEL